LLLVGREVSGEFLLLVEIALQCTEHVKQFSFKTEYCCAVGIFCLHIAQMSVVIIYCTETVFDLKTIWKLFFMMIQVEIG